MITQAGPRVRQALACEPGGGGRWPARRARRAAHAGRRPAPAAGQRGRRRGADHARGARSTSSTTTCSLACAPRRADPRRRRWLDRRRQVDARQLPRRPAGQPGRRALRPTTRLPSSCTTRPTTGGSRTSGSCPGWPAPGRPRRPPTLHLVASDPCRAGSPCSTPPTSTRSDRQPRARRPAARGRRHVDVRDDGGALRRRGAVGVPAARRRPAARPSRWCSTASRRRPSTRSAPTSPRCSPSTGWATPPLFVVAETTTYDALLPPEHVDPMRNWLHRLADDADARAAVVRHTLTGALGSLARAVPSLAAAPTRRPRRSCGCARRRPPTPAAGPGSTQGMEDGSLLRGEVLARWQEFVGTGEIMRALESKVSRMRDRVTAAPYEASRPRTGALEALESGRGGPRPRGRRAARPSRRARPGPRDPARRSQLARRRRPARRSPAPGWPRRPPRPSASGRPTCSSSSRDQAQGKRSTARAPRVRHQQPRPARDGRGLRHTGGLTGGEVADAGGASAAEPEGPRGGARRPGGAYARRRPPARTCTAGSTRCSLRSAAATTNCSTPPTSTPARGSGSARRSGRSRRRDDEPGQPDAVAAPRAAPPRRPAGDADSASTRRCSSARAGSTPRPKAAPARCSRGPVSGCGTPASTPWSRWPARPAAASPRCSTRCRRRPVTGRRTAAHDVQGVRLRLGRGRRRLAAQWLGVPRRQTQVARVGARARTTRPSSPVSSCSTCPTTTRPCVDAPARGRPAGRAGRPARVGASTRRSTPTRSLHEDYLRRLAGHEAVTVVVLNQVDTVNPFAAAECADDLRRLLDARRPAPLAGARDCRHARARLDGLRALLAEAGRSRRRPQRPAGRRRRAGASIARPLVGVGGGADGSRRRRAQQLVSALASSAGVPVVGEAVGASWRLRAGRLPAGRRRGGSGGCAPTRCGGCTSQATTSGGTRAVAGRSSMPAPTPVQRAQVDTALRGVVAVASEPAAGLAATPCAGGSCALPRRARPPRPGGRRHRPGGRPGAAGWRLLGALQWAVTARRCGRPLAARPPRLTALPAAARPADPVGLGHRRCRRCCCSAGSRRD